MKKYANVSTGIPGPHSSYLLNEWVRYEADKTGFQAQIAVDHASGAMIFDVDGNSFIDWTSGVLVTNTGHCHPYLVEKVSEALSRIMNVYEYCNEYRVTAAKALVEAAPSHLNSCFFMTTGSEVTDAAVRIMRKASKKFEIINFFGGFHGRTLSTVSIGGLSKVKKGMGPLLPGSIRAPYPYCYRCPFASEPHRCHFLCLEFVDDIVQANSTGSLAGLIVEPYQGTAGFIFPPQNYLSELSTWAKSREILFALDEVQSSFGRTGTMWACEHEALVPDILLAGKGIGGGVPASAILIRKDLIDLALGKGELGSTFGGNPIGSAAVSAVLDIFKSDNILSNVTQVSSIFSQRLPSLAEKSHYVGDIRGMGLVWGIELVEDKVSKTPAPILTRKLITLCAEEGLLIGSVGYYNNVIRVAPPLVINEDQAEESISIMEHCLDLLGRFQ